MVFKSYHERKRMLSSTCLSTNVYVICTGMIYRILPRSNSHPTLPFFPSFTDISSTALTRS